MSGERWPRRWTDIEGRIEVLSAARRAWSKASAGSVRDGPDLGQPLRLGLVPLRKRTSCVGGSLSRPQRRPRRRLRASERDRPCPLLAVDNCRAPRLLSGVGQGQVTAGLVVGSIVRDRWATSRSPLPTRATRERNSSSSLHSSVTVSRGTGSVWPGPTIAADLCSATSSPVETIRAV